MNTHYKNFVIADAGGTSTNWSIVLHNEEKYFKTEGFNAFTHNLNEYICSLKSFFEHLVMKEVFSVHYYAAGADSLSIRKEITSALSEIFRENTIEVHSDMLGASRALCKNNSGNVAILGTGANSCFYDGEKIEYASASLGYVVGDEGSGAYLGKKLLKGVYRRQWDDQLLETFYRKYSMDEHQMIQKVYREPMPNQFLATFSYFIAEHRSHPQIRDLLYETYHLFFEEFFPKKNDYNFYFVGSIAHCFSDLLRKVADEKKIIIQNILKNPLPELVNYHRNYEKK